MITALAGGVGAARFLIGLTGVVDPATVTAVVNTGDDTVFHGLHVSPDLDTVTYTLAGAINGETGWGLAGESWRTMEALARYEPEGALTWFNLGDRDLGTHLFRTGRLREGAPLSEVTAEVARSWGVAVRLLPMSDDRVETRVVTDEGEIGFQEYFVKLRHAVPVREVVLVGAAAARPAPGVLDAVAAAGALVICPSNPIVSIGPILAVPGLSEALQARRASTVAISPIIAGAALKGPADRMLRELGHEPSVIGVARLYRDIAATLVIDEADAVLAPAVEAEGIRCCVTDTIMSGPGVACALARVALEAAGYRTDR